MKTITVLAVIAMFVLEVAGPASSVGGSLSFMLVLVAVVLAVAIHEAWSNRRGAFGWIVNIFVSAFGALLAVALIGIAMEAMLPHLHLEGPFASWQNPLKYLAVAAIAILMVWGSWIPLWIANRFR